jgi:serine/threonine protein kinase/TolA-binding protein
VKFRQVEIETVGQVANLPLVMTPSDNPRDLLLADCLDQALAQRRAGRPVDPLAFPSPAPDLGEDLAALLQTMLDLDSAAYTWRGSVPAAKPEPPRSDPAGCDTATNLESRFPPESCSQGPIPSDQNLAHRLEYNPTTATHSQRPLPSAQVSSHAGLGQGPQRIGRYLILAKLGSGGMGTVYKGLDEHLQRVVAVKVPRFDAEHPDHGVAVQRFLREARSAALIRHARVCPIYDSGEDGGRPYVVMAYVEGQSLAEKLTGNRRLEDLGQAVALALQVADALHVVHSHGIIHRDLKPGNILVDRDGQVILTDFGLARPENDTERLTAEGALLGTPAYMAPEQATGDTARLGTWTDIYSLGVVFFKLITGRLPFEGPTLALIFKAVYESPPPPSRYRDGLDPELDTIVLKALARQPEERYQTAREFAGALEAWADKQKRAVETLVADAPGSTEAGSTPMEIQAALPDGRKVAVTIQHPGVEAGKVNVKVSDRPPTRRKRRRFTVSITLAFSLLLLVAGGAALWMAKAGLDWAIRPLVDAGRYEEALDAVDQAGFLTGPFKGEWREKVLDNWHGQVELLVSQQQYDQAEQVALRIVRRFPDDEPAIAALSKAYEADLPRLFAIDRFEKAKERLDRPGIPTAVRERWYGEIERQWVKRARSLQAAKGRSSEALRMARAILKHFEGSGEARTIRHQILVTMVLEILGERPKLEDYETALEQVKKFKSEMSDDGKVIRRKILGMLMAKARQEVKAGSGGESRATCALILKHFDGTAEFSATDRAEVDSINQIQPRPEFERLVTKVTNQIKAKQFEAALNSLKGPNVPAAENPAEETQLAKLKNQALAGRIEELLELAAREYASGKWGLCEGHLDEGVTLVASLGDRARAAEQLKEIHLRQSLLWLKEPTPKAEKVQRAIRLTRNVLSSPLPKKLLPLLKPVCEALQPVAKDWKATAEKAENATGAIQALELAHKKLQNPAHKVALRSFLDQIGEAREELKFLTLLQEAETELAKGTEMGNQKCLVKLQGAAQHAKGDGVKRDHIDELKGLLFATGFEEGESAAVDIFERLLPKDNLRRRLAMCEAFARVAKANAKDYLARAVGAFGPHLANPMWKEVDRKALGQLFKSLIERASKLKETDDWNKLAEKLNNAGDNPWAIACKAECILAAADYVVDPPTGQKARALVTDWNKVAGAGPYAHYVRALVFKAGATPLQEVGKELHLAFPGKASQSHLGPERQERAAEVFREAAWQIHRQAQPKAFREGDADLVYPWLLTARELTKTHSRDFRVLLALAAWYKDPTASDLELADTVLVGLRKNPGLEKLEGEAYLLLMGKARNAKTGPGKLQCYEEILDLVENKAFTVPAKDLHGKVLQPAIQLILAEEPRKPAPRLAKFYSMQGELFVNYADQFERAFPRAVDSFTEAIRWDGLPNYYANRAFAKAWDRRPFTEVEDDLKTALDIDPDYAPAYGLKARFAIGVALQKKGKEKIAELKKAGELYETALKKCKNNREQQEGKAAYLTDLSFIEIELAHLEPEKRAEHLKAAVDYSENAISFPHPRLHDALNKRASAYEDQAWMLGETAKYWEAIVLYRRAATKHPKGKVTGEYELSIGRCYYKWVKDGGGDPKDLRTAASELTKALGKKPKALEECEARYWLGKVYYLQGEFDRAVTQLSKAQQIADEGTGESFEEWRGLCAAEGAQMRVDRAAADAAKGRNVNDLLKQAKELVDKVKSMPYWAAYLQGRVLELSKDNQGIPQFKEAYEKYKSALPEDKSVPLEAARLYLALVQLLLNERADAVLKKVEGKPTLAEMAKTLDQLVTLAKRRVIFGSWDRAETHAVAGMVQLELARAEKDEPRQKQLHAKGLRLLNMAKKLAPRHPKREHWQQVLDQEMR